MSPKNIKNLKYLENRWFIAGKINQINLNTSFIEHVDQQATMVRTNRYVYPGAMILLLLVAAGLRFYHLDYQSFWVDEISSMNGSDPDRSWAGVIEYCHYDQPPAYFLLMHAWFKLFPFNDFSGRVPATLLGLAGIVAMFFFGKEVNGSRTGLIAAIITTFSYIHIYFSQEARFYTLLFLATALSYLFFIRSTKLNSVRDFAFYVIFTSLTIYTHYFGLVVFATQGILFCLLLACYGSSRKFIYRAVASAIAVAVSIIPWMPVFFSDIQIQEFWIQMEPFYFPIRYFYVYFKDAVSCVAFGSILLYYGFRISKQFSSNRSISKIDFILIGCVAISMLIPLVYSLVRTPMLQVRYTLIILPGLILMISLGIQYLSTRYQWIVVVVTCCTSFVSLLLFEQFYTRIRKEDWRGIITHIVDEGHTGDMVISSQPAYCNYYFKIKGSETRALSAAELSLATNSPAGIWWADAFQVETVPAEVASWLDVNGYVVKKHYKLFHASVTYFQRK
jgi:mannosyltransferase